MEEEKRRRREEEKKRRRVELSCVELCCIVRMVGPRYKFVRETAVSFLCFPVSSSALPSAASHHFNKQKNKI